MCSILSTSQPSDAAIGLRDRQVGSFSYDEIIKLDSDYRASYG